MRVPSIASARSNSKKQSILSRAKRALYMSLCAARGKAFPRYLDNIGDYLGQAAGADFAQKDMLRALLIHAIDSVPFYSKLQGVREELAVAEDPFSYLEYFPILERTTLRENYASLVSTRCVHTKAFSNTSGGSTGEPVLLLQDVRFRDFVATAAILHTKAVGRLPGEPEIVLWGSERDILLGTNSPLSRIGNWLTDTHYVNAFRLSEEKLFQFVDSVNRIQPKTILAYAQSIYEAAKFVRQQGLTVKHAPSVITSAGTLYSYMREEIEEAFNCRGRVFDRYGSREVGLVAAELPGRVGLYVPPWLNYVEIVDPVGSVLTAGVGGDVVVTNLVNLAMPFIRYRIGDRAELATIGRPGAQPQVLSRVLGRSSDSFYSNDGAIVDGEYFTHLLYFRPWLKQFQVIQESSHVLIFRFVLRDSQVPPSAEIEDISLKSKLALGGDVNVQYEYVSRIEASSSGKFRYTVCRM